MNTDRTNVSIILLTLSLEDIIRQLKGVIVIPLKVGK